MFGRKRKAYESGYASGYRDAAAGWRASVDRLSDTIARLRAVQLSMCNSSCAVLVVVSRKRYAELKQTGRYTEQSNNGLSFLIHNTPSGDYHIVTPNTARGINLGAWVA